MSLKALVNAVYNANVGLASIRYRQEPTGAVGVAVADDALWDQIIAGTVLTVDHWLVGLNIGVVGLGADVEEVIAEGIGGVDGAAVAAATLLVEQDFNGFFTQTTAVGEYAGYIPPSYLPVPCLCSTTVVANGLRHAGRISSSAAGGLAISLGIAYITGLGS